MKRAEYRRHKRALQIQLVALQRHLIAHEQRLVVILEGRDAAGKDGTIKRITQHMSPRETRVVALGRPSDRDRASWYFQRYVPHLPADGEIVLFNRSWYNRAGVERVMGFCSEAEYEAFFRDVLAFERLIAASGTKSDWAIGPPGGCAGAVNAPTPIIGKHGMVGAISPGRSAALSRARRTRMFRSTRSRSIAKPEYGVAGVPSTIHEPYSGTHAHRS